MVDAQAALSNRLRKRLYIVILLEPCVESESRIHLDAISLHGILEDALFASREYKLEWVIVQRLR